MMFYRYSEILMLVKVLALFPPHHQSGRLSSRLHSDVDRMGRTVALNANALVRSTFKTCLMFRVMLSLSWELTVLTCIEMPLLAVVQNKYITLTKVRVENVDLLIYSPSCVH